MNWGRMIHNQSIVRLGILDQILQLNHFQNSIRLVSQTRGKVARVLIRKDFPSIGRSGPQNVASSCLSRPYALPLRGTIRPLRNRLRSQEVGMRILARRRKGTIRGDSIPVHRVNRKRPVQCMTHQSIILLYSPFHLKAPINACRAPQDQKVFFFLAILGYTSNITPKKRLWSGGSSFCWSEDTPFSTFYDANAISLLSVQLPNDHSASTSPRKTQSSENINTNFSPSGWHGKFNGDAEDYLGAKSNGNTPRGRTSPTKGRPNVHTPFRERPRPTEPKENIPPYDSTKMPPPPPSPMAPLPPRSPEKVPFSEEQWRETFKDPNWVYPGPPPMQSPRTGNMKRPKHPRKMSTANKRPTVPKPAHVSATIDKEDEGDASNEASSVLESEANHSSSDNAMDIDPALTPPSGMAHFSATGTHGQTYIDPITRIIRSAAPPPSQTNSDTDKDASRLNLSGFKKEVPFAPSQSGLKDLEDLKSTLPFPSAPSAIPGQSSAPQQLALPAPPRPPNALDKVTQSTFDQYMAYMHAYMAEWSMYNTKMLTHFNTRQNEVENELGNDWMSSIGMQGYAKYMRGVEEDFRVRKHWDVSWEKHRECMKALGKVREKAVKAQCSV